MNAETRAKELLRSIMAMKELPDFKESVALIAAALRSAENDKLEEARQRILEGHDEAWGNPAEQHGWDQAAQRIEVLKSKDTP